MIGDEGGCRMSPGQRKGGFVLKVEWKREGIGDVRERGGEVGGR